MSSGLGDPGGHAPNLRLARLLERPSTSCVNVSSKSSQGNTIMVVVPVEIDSGLGSHGGCGRGMR
jgi:hypothetical protein